MFDPIILALLRSGSRSILGLALLTAPATPASMQAPTTCQPSWLPTFGGAQGVNGNVRAMATYDDGHGPALYVGGDFWAAGGTVARSIAKWDGLRWSAPTGQLNAAVTAMTVFDDGSGPALFVGGDFTGPGNHVAKWNGVSWSALGSGLSAHVSALAVFDDGSGAKLYAGGTFTAAGALPANHIARWDGSGWSALGSGTDQAVASLCVFDDGSGRALYAGGAFTSAGGSAANRIAKWDGSGWSALGSGTNQAVASLAVFDDGSGPALFAGGQFTTAGGISATRISKWNGSNWSAVGGGVNNVVSALAVYDDGSGPALYAAGALTSAGGVPANYLGRWDGSSWSALAGGTSQPVYALAVFDSGSGPALHAGGSFVNAGSAPADFIARWNGTAWSPLGSGLDRDVEALTVFDDGSGPALFVGGYFEGAGGLWFPRIGKWNGSVWSDLSIGAPGMGNRVRALAVFDDGSGPALYAAGWFGMIGSSLANFVARWDGSNWSPLGTGIQSPVYPGVAALAVFDDGSGPALYAGGAFTGAGGAPANCIAKWNGSSWSALGSGLSGVNTSVSALTVFDDGSGPSLYVGGTFTSAGGIPANSIARWNSSGWSALGSGITMPPYPASVFSLCGFDGGGGPELYVGGGFAVAGGTPANSIAKWNGSSWSALGNGPGGSVRALSVFDDGSGPALYAGGGLYILNDIAKWDGTSWRGLGAGIHDWTGDEVLALAVFDAGSGPELIAGGSFRVSSGGDSYLARWGNLPGCGVPGVSICEPGAGGVGACPCGNAPASAGRGCNNSVGTGGASLAASGIARLGYDTLEFTTSGEMPSATSIVLQGDGTNPAGSVLGQGVNCVAGNLKRLYVATAAGGSIHAPESGEARVHLRSAALGDTIAPGTQRFYGVYYRDPVVLGGCPASRTYNITQQLDVLWAP